MKSEAKTRIISGACYLVIVALFFVCRILWRAFIFDGLLWVFSALATFEIARATKKYSLPCAFLLSVILGAINPIIYFIVEHFLLKLPALLIFLGIDALAVIALLIVTLITKDSFKRFGVSVLSVLYPSIGILCMFLINDISHNIGLFALVLIFAIPMLSDTCAYAVGTIYNNIKKGAAKKMCPDISPKKTWAGFVGAIIGGAIATIIVYLIFMPIQNKLAGAFVFLLIGIVASIVNVFGDLFESYIKRKAGIKDSGKLIPGHGGVLDRIDGMLFTAIYIFLMVLIIIL